MTQDNIPDDVRRFILTSIASVPFLEAMLLLRTDPSAAWDARRLAQGLYIAEKVAEDLLHELSEAGFASPAESAEKGFRFQPSSAELEHMCGRLADVYASNIVAVTNLIHSNVGRRAQQFADAFKWRKD